MKQWMTAAVFVSLLGSAALVAAQTPSGSKQGGSAGAGSKGQSGSATGQQTKAGAQASSGPAAVDGMFIRTAAMDGMAEVEHGRLAAQNATHDEVKQFGQRMADDHGKANDELKGLASQKSVTLPAELDAKHKAMHDKLSKMKGDAFDRAYMAHMVTAHQQAVGLFSKESKAGKDSDVKAWAAKTLPTLQEHLKLAQSVNSTVAKGGKTAASQKK